MRSLGGGTCVLLLGLTAAPFAPAHRADVGPALLEKPAAAYDRGRQRFVLFGGRDASAVLRAETWEWDGVRWQLAASGGPAPRMLHGMAYDEARRRVVLFGGSGSDSRDPAALGDTWEWDGRTWARVAVDGPSPRQTPAMAYDAKRGRVVLYGGTPGDGQPSLDDTWEWDGRTWMRIAAGSALPRSFHAAAYDVRRARTLVYAGRGGKGTLYGYDGHGWTLVAEGGPGPRDHHAMAYDVSRDRLVVYGGGAQPFDGTFLADTWEFDGQAWKQVEVAGPGPRGGMPVMAYDARRAVTLLYGGVGPAGLLSDLWAWDGRAWRRLWSAVPAGPSS
jgi:hypothetical protein